MNSIKKISAEETYLIRKKVLRKNIDLPYKLKGDFDENSIHFGAFKDSEIVGVVSFMEFSTDVIEGFQYQLRGMATLSEVRGEGFGQLLIAKGAEVLKEKGVKNVWCNAREVAIGFYKKNGFTIIGDLFYIEKVGVHYKMVKKLK